MNKQQQHNEAEINFNSEEKASEIRKNNELAKLRECVAKKDANSIKSILVGVLVWVLMIAGIWLSVVACKALDGGWLDKTSFIADWAEWKVYCTMIGICFIPMTIAMIFQWLLLAPLIRLIMWEKAGRYDYKKTTIDKVAIVFAILTYIAYRILTAILKLVAMIAIAKK